MFLPNSSIFSISHSYVNVKSSLIIDQSRYLLLAFLVGCQMTGFAQTRLEPSGAATSITNASWCQHPGRPPWPDQQELPFHQLSEMGHINDRDLKI